MIVPIWIKALIVATVLAAIAWKVDNYLDSVEQRGYDRAKTEYLEKTVKAQDDAIEAHNRAISAVYSAIKERNEREKSIRAMADAAGLAVGGLRNDLDAVRAGVPAATVDALRNTAATLTVVLGECANEYRELAEKADRHASDTRAMTEAWPTGKAD